MKHKSIPRLASNAYTVGYGKPPISNRWKSGESGNPKGRPKKRLDAPVLLSESLKRTIEVEDRGQKRRITVREAIVLCFVRQALKGNLKAIQYIFANDAEAADFERELSKLDTNISSDDATQAYLRLIAAPRVR